jgi:hypothetical protein
MIRVIFQEEYATVTYNDDLQLGKIDWHGNPDPEQYKKPFEAMLQLALSGVPVKKFLSDIRKQGIINPDSRKWFEKDMMPLAIREGLVCGASIFDGNAFKKYYMNMIIAASGKFGLPLKLFNTEEEAIDWLNRTTETRAEKFA